jgi:hypothetical protein
MENWGQDAVGQAARSAPLDDEMVQSVSNRLEQLLEIEDGGGELFTPLVFALRRSTSESEHLSARLQSLCLQVEALFLPSVLQDTIEGDQGSVLSPTAEKLAIQDPVHELNTIEDALREARDEAHLWTQETAMRLERFSDSNPDMHKVLRLYFLQLMGFGNALVSQGMLESLPLVSPLWSDEQAALFYAAFRDLICLSSFMRENNISVPEPYFSSLEKIEYSIMEAVIATRIVAQLEADPVGLHDNEMDMCSVLRHTNPNSFRELVETVSSAVDARRKRALLAAASIDSDIVGALRWNQVCVLFVYQLMECCLSWHRKLDMVQELFGDAERELSMPSKTGILGAAALEAVLRGLQISLTAETNPDQSVVAAASKLSGHETATCDKSDETLNPQREDRLSRFSRDFEALKRRHQASRERGRHRPQFSKTREHSFDKVQSDLSSADLSVIHRQTTENVLEYIQRNAAQLRKRLDPENRQSPANWYVHGIRPVLCSFERLGLSPELMWIRNMRQRLDAYAA